MRRCLGCFNNIKDELGICPFCGYVVGSPAESDIYIKPGSVLSARYVIGKVIKRNSFCLTYLAWDKNSRIKVDIREYFPLEFATRLAGTSKVMPLGEAAKKEFDSGFDSFVSEAKGLFSGSGKTKLYDCIAENGTAYMILEHKEIKKNSSSASSTASALSNKKAVSRQDSKESITVIKAQKKENSLYRFKRKISLIPTWVKIVVPLILVVGTAITLLIVNGVFSKKPDVTEGEDITIPSEVLTWGDHSYALFNHCTKWDEAEAYCEALGGHLVVITSQEENNTINDYIQIRGFEYAYIGYSDLEVEGVWRWVNGESSNFTSWNDGEPNTFVNENDYAVFSGSDTGVWIASDYVPSNEGETINFMCEWDSIVEGTSNITYQQLLEEKEDFLNNLDYVSNLSVGDTFTYGIYDEEPIEWVILDIQGPQVFALTTEVIENGTYNSSNLGVTWRSCSLRSWLNEDFYYSAFSHLEQNRIENTLVSTEANSMYDTVAGVPAYDKVFLLSVDEANQYFASDDERICAYDGEASLWWLRTPGVDQNYASYVADYGTGYLRGQEVTEVGGIRPAMWINLESNVEDIVNQPSDTDMEQLSATLSSIRAGDVFRYGNYNGGELAWLALDIQSNHVLAITVDAVDVRSYNYSNDEVTWSTSTLRTWLNEDFYYSAFSDIEQSRIVTSIVSADVNPEYDTNPGVSTMDNVFLLSSNEYNELFRFDDYRACRFEGVEQYWWLRSPGTSQQYVECVDTFYDSINDFSIDFSMAVRPAIWIDISN